jgi:hypothetical protein
MVNFSSARALCARPAKIVARAEEGATPTGAMVDPCTSGLLDELDGLNATRALILQAYYTLRRLFPPTRIGAREIAAWITHYEPDESQPSIALIQLTLAHAKVPHRAPGRPRRESLVPVAASPLLSRLRHRALPPR